MATTIDNFSGPYGFLSNFFPAPITFDGIRYPTSEHAFQAAKTLDQEERKRIAEEPSPGRAKRLGQKVTLRPGWDGMRVAVMEKLLRAKFSYPELRDQLLDTGDAELIEGNVWKDKFWGVCGGVGENQLGKLLMKIRDELKPV